jgi:hypothetical protein
MDHKEKAILNRLLREAEDNAREIAKVLHIIREIERDLRPRPITPTSVTFKEISMLPTTGGNTQVYSGSLVPAGSSYPTDSTFTVTSNDPAVLPTVDSTGLIVTVPLPAGWVESTTVALAIAYAAASASNPSMAVTATITPSAPVVLPTGITFTQTV